MQISINPDLGYNQRFVIATLDGSFTFLCKYNRRLKRWLADITNLSTGITVYGVILTPKRNYEVLKQVGWNTLLSVMLGVKDERIIYIFYEGV